MNLARNVGGSGGIAMINTMLARRAQFHQQSLVSHLTRADGSYTEALRGIASNIAAQGASVADAASQAQGVLYGMVQRNATMLAINDNFWILAVVCVALIPGAFLMKRNTPHKGAVVME
jgi:DHA2 family multidrug resistance protein